jgi:hypothetical protein
MDERSPADEKRPALLAVSGLVVSTAALVAALRLYVPQLSAIEPLDGGRFLLLLAGADQGEQAEKE